MQTKKSPSSITLSYRQGGLKVWNRVLSNEEVLLDYEYAKASAFILDNMQRNAVLSSEATYF